MTQTTRSDHRAAVMALLHDHGPLSRADVARASGLSGATVRRVVDRLRRDGFVREVVAPGDRPGRPPWSVELRPDAAFVVGIDAGGSMLRGVLADLEGSIRARVARPARDPGDADALLADLAGVARDAAAAAGDRRILALAAGISGIVDHDAGLVRISPDLPGLSGVDVAARLGDALGVPATIDNDDLLAAVGEVAAGAAKGVRNAVFLSLGYGLGAGIVVDGRPLRGAANAAGAVAFIGTPPMDERASGRVIPGRYLAAVARSGLAGADSHRAGLDARGVFERAATGDPVARGLVADVVGAIAELAVTVAAVVDPDVVILGGGVAANGAVVFDAVEERLRATLPYPPRVVASTLEGAAVVHGAVAVALANAWRSLPGTERAQDERAPLAPDTALHLT